ncbi:MAG: hypothetical protein IKK34_11045 [Clostridia bacterium]|nr:hypothetical protein [Clostridia bacterium]
MEEQTPRRRRRPKPRKKSRWPLIAVLAAILVLLALIVYLLFSILGGRQSPAPQVSPVPAAASTPVPDATEIPEAYVIATLAPKLEIDPNAGALITPTPAPQEPGVAIPGWGSMTIPAGVTEVQTSMQNPAANEGWYYLTFQLRMKDTGEVLFTTGLIPPGQYCNKVTLTRALEPGEYPAIIHVQPYRISDQSPTNNADMETVLIVK